MSATYAVAKAIGAVLFSLGALVVWAWSRSFLSPIGALTATGLTLLLPFFALAGTLSTEAAFFPAFLLGCLAVARALERPTPARQAVALAAIGLATLTRFQGIVLVAVLATCALAWRERRLWPSLAVLAVAGLVWVAAHGFALGVYTQATDASYSTASLARWLLYTPGVVALVVGVAPAAALLALLPDRGRSRAERAFVVVAAAAVALDVRPRRASPAHGCPPGQGALRDPRAAAAARRAPALDRARDAAAVVGDRAAGRARRALPFRTIFASSSFPSNGIDLYPWQRLDVHVGHVRSLAVAAALGAAVLFVLRRRRELLVLLALYLALGSAAAQATVRSHSLDARRLAGGAFELDRRGGRQGRARDDPEHHELRGGDADERAVPHLDADLGRRFWNRSLRASLGFGFAEPAPLPQSVAHLDFATGTVSPEQLRPVRARRPPLPTGGRAAGGPRPVRDLAAAPAAAVRLGRGRRLHGRPDRRQRGVHALARRRGHRRRAARGQRQRRVAWGRPTPLGAGQATLAPDRSGALSPSRRRSGCRLARPSACR